jgi:uncharacterized protein YbcI
MVETPEPGPGRPAGGSRLTRAISAEIVALYKSVYGHDRTTATTYINDNVVLCVLENTATTYINDNVVLCVLENILTEHEATLIDAGSSGEVVDARVAFQTDTEDEFTEAIERLTQRRVVAFMSANQTTPGVAAELFFLDATPSNTEASGQ